MSQINIGSDQEIRILVVDDEVSIVNSISDTLGGEGYHLRSFSDSKQALDHLTNAQYDLALIDINMPVVDGQVLSKSFIRHNNDAEVIIITGVPDESNIDIFLKQGFTHFLFKPFNKSQLIYSVYAALHFQRIRKSLTDAKLGANGSKLVGISSWVRTVRDEIGLIAKTDIPVLITGESGTGKEIIAQEVHASSNRSNKKFLPINCAVLGAIAESELFGHTKGSFTGSVSTTAGHVGVAEGGTIFLDEVGELSLDIQAKMLRFLDRGEYMKVGDSRLRYADVRIIAATNRDLEKMCSEKLFREDLYYRLSGSLIRTEPLSKRKEDIMPLIFHFLSQFGTLQDKTLEISSEAAERLVESRWPGNVRQLKQTLFHISKLATHDRILTGDVERVLGADGKPKHPKFKEAKQQVIEEFERTYLLRTLQLAQGNLKRALELSGMHKKNFYTKINNLGYHLKDFPQ